MNVRSRAVVSWASDAVGTVAVLVLLANWLSDIRAGSARHLSLSFFNEGFCLSPVFDSTHLTCAGFDVACGLGFIFTALLVDRGGGGDGAYKAYLGVAAYLFSHGYGHYHAGTELAEPGSTREERMGTVDLLLLSAILSIGPMKGVTCLVEAGKIGRRTANAAAALGLAVLVGIYALFIRRPVYALLYINISIILSGVLPRTLVIGYTSERDIAIRSKLFTWPRFLVDTFVIFVVILEPFYCDSFLSGIGGHLIFDISLLFQAVVYTVGNPTIDTKQKIQ